MRNRTTIIFALVFALCATLSIPAFALVEKMNTDQLVSRSALVLHGRVIKVHARPTEDPMNLETEVTVQVEEAIKGQVASRLTFVLPGGSIGERFMFLTDIPEFSADQEVVLFMDDTHSKLTGLIQGKTTLESGVVVEKKIDAYEYLDALRDLAAGIPSVELDDTFEPISMTKAYIDRHGDKFGYDGMKWSSHSVGISINSNTPDTGGELAAVQAAMSAWTNAPANFSFVYQGSNSRTSYKQNYSNEAFWGWDDPGGAIAYAVTWGYANEIAEVDLTFLEQFKWSSDNNPSWSEMDIQNIATHEFGHFLQLLDLYSNGDAAKTMYGYAGEGETNKRSLEVDDKNGIAHIYGSGPGDDDDDDATDDDDDASGDDDDNDDASDDDDDDLPGSQSCVDLLEVIYNTCDLEFYTGGEPIPGRTAYDMCKADDGPWDCVAECLDHDQVTNCSLLADCLDQKCGVNAKEDRDSGSGDGGGDSGSSCGF
jgi:matrixin